MARNQDANEANSKFLQFVRYQFLTRLAKSLPNVILRHDQKWPAAPESCKQVFKWWDEMQNLTSSLLCFYDSNSATQIKRWWWDDGCMLIRRQVISYAKFTDASSSRTMCESWALRGNDNWKWNIWHMNSSKVTMQFLQLVGVDVNRL